MKILLLHSDFIKWEPKKKAIKQAEDVPKKPVEVRDVLVVFSAVESGDRDVKKVSENTVKEVLNVLKEVKAKNVVLYPYAHLSPDLAKPDQALRVLKGVEKGLKGKNVPVKRAPFGWYKAFNVSCKGHPLAELSKTITENVKGAKTREEVTSKIKSEYFLLDPSGKEEKLDLKRLDKSKILSSHPDLKSFVIAEEVKDQPSKEPPSIKAMQRLELVGYEEASDPGNFKFYPKGNLVFELLKDWCEEIAVNRFGSMVIETPLIYDWSRPDIKAQGESFHERHYMVRVPDEKNKELVLRFAGDFGLFSMLKNTTISYRNLPMRIYELSPSFRYEKRGELSGLKRLRAFTMPDIHSFCRDLEQGWEEYKDLFRNYTDLANATGIEYVVAFRIVKEFYQKHKKHIIELLKYCKKPAFIEVLSGMKHYWAVKHEFQGIDSVGGNTQLSTVQLDVEDAERYGIMFTDRDNKKKGCIICHSSVGSIERWIYTILEHALKDKNPLLPTWLSPTQVRLCPVNESFMKDCEKIADQLTKENIRVDIDDRVESVQRKIRDSEFEWTPYTVVFGEREKDTGKLAVRFRKTGKVQAMSIKALGDLIKKETRGFPYRPLPMDRLLTRRPVFAG